MMPEALRGWLAGGRTGVKICGITREEDAQEAIAAGADALGFNFYPRSKRAVRLEAIAGWVEKLPAGIACVAVVVQPEENLLRALAQSGLFHALQFHGGEEPDFCAAWGGGFHIKARPMAGASSVAAALSDPAPCLLLDAHAPDVYGGTGRTVDWTLAAEVTAAAARPVVLSGGLHPNNVAAAIRCVRPAAVDVASGVESSPGIKDAVLLRAFVTAVRTE